MGDVTRQVRAFYRSPLTPVAFVLTGMFCAWSLSPFGPDAWKTVPSLQLLRHALPFPVMSLGFLIYVLLLLTRNVHAVIAADFFGGVMYLSECGALAWTARGGVTNPILLSASFLAIVLHALALRLAIYDEILI